MSKQCPGFMVIPCKPHPFENKYHYIEDRIEDGDQGKSVTRIIWHSWASVSEPGMRRQWAMFQITEPIHNPGQVIIMIKGILEMDRVGVFGQVLMKNMVCIGQRVSNRIISRLILRVNH